MRSAKDTDEITISGEPIVYEADYSVMDMFGEFTERMAPGVASDVLADGADVRFLFNHDGLPLARSTSGTLSLTDGPKGLTFQARLDARQQLANDLAIAIERGDVSQMSCGFIVARDEWDEAMEDRTVLKFADLLDVSAVTYPASPSTSIQIAQRMAMEIPVESRARLRQYLVAERAGKVLSGPSKEKVAAAIEALLGLHEAGGGNVADFMPESAEQAQTDGANADPAAGQAFLDGTGERSETLVDPGEKIRTKNFRVPSTWRSNWHASGSASLPEQHAVRTTGKSSWDRPLGLVAGLLGSGIRVWHINHTKGQGHERSKGARDER